MVADRGRGEVAGHGEGGGGREMPVPQPVPYGKSPQGRGEEPGGEGVPGTDLGDDVDVRRGHEGDVTPVEDGGPAPALLDDERLGVGERGPYGIGPDEPPDLGGLVLADEHEVRTPRQLQQHVRPVGRTPQRGTVVDVERDQRAVRADRGQLTHQAETVGGQHRGDPGQMQHPPAPYGGQVHVRDAHRGGGGTGPVVRHLVRVGGPVPGGTEVDTGRPRGITPYGRHIHPVPTDGLDEMITEAVRPHPADPPHGVSGGGQHAGDIRLRAADGAIEGRHVGEAAGPAG